MIIQYNFKLHEGSFEALILTPLIWFPVRLTWNCSLLCLRKLPGEAVVGEVQRPQPEPGSPPASL